MGIHTDPQLDDMKILKDLERCHKKVVFIKPSPPGSGSYVVQEEGRV